MAARWWRVCGGERELFKEATCVRETRELVCRLAADKSLAPAFFNCVPPTPAPVLAHSTPPLRPPASHLPRGPIISPFFPTFFPIFPTSLPPSFLPPLFFPPFPESARFYRSIARLTPRTRPYRPRNRAGSNGSSIGKRKNSPRLRGDGRPRVNRRDRILFSIGVALFMPGAKRAPETIPGCLWRIIQPPRRRVVRFSPLSPRYRGRDSSRQCLYSRGLFSPPISPGLHQIPLSSAAFSSY